MRLPSNLYKRLPLWATRAIDAYQIWDAQLGGWLSRLVGIAVSLGAALWTYLGESWLPMAVVAGLGLYVLTPKLLANHMETGEKVSNQIGAPVTPSTAPLTNEDDNTKSTKLAIATFVRGIFRNAYDHQKQSLTGMIHSYIDFHPDDARSRVLNRAIQVDLGLRTESEIFAICATHSSIGGANLSRMEKALIDAMRIYQLRASFM